MAAEDLVSHDSCHGQAVEAVSKSLPKLDGVASLACSQQSIEKVQSAGVTLAALGKGKVGRGAREVRD